MQAEADRLVFEYCHVHGWVRGLVCVPWAPRPSSLPIPAKSPARGSARPMNKLCPLAAAQGRLFPHVARSSCPGFAEMNMLKFIHGSQVPEVRRQQR